MSTDPLRPDEFVPGVELSRRYWHGVVAPIVRDLLPSDAVAAARMGDGSDVLGFDTPRSTDHGWGPRVTIFLDDDADLSAERLRHLRAVVDARLPETFGGFPTRFAASEGDAPTHQVLFTTVRAWFTSVLGFDPRDDVTATEWLAAPSQLLRVSVSGDVFDDPNGGLTEARRRLDWYPDDVWLYLLGCQWRRIDQEEPFVGRTGEVGDELGSAVVAARLVRDFMRLCFLMERQYVPYSKWLGSAFSRLACASVLTPLFRQALSATDWNSREAALVTAAEEIARRFNSLGIVDEQDVQARHFYTRPFLVLASSRFVDACMARTPLRRLGYAGGIDQFIDSTDVLSDERALRARKAMIEISSEHES